MTSSSSTPPCLTLLVTGATGYFGQALIPLLKERGHRLICLVRGPDAEARARSLLPSLDKGDCVVEGNVTDTLDDLIDRLREWKGEIQGLVHSAGRVQFDEVSRTEVFHTNVEGTRNLLALAGKLNIPEFHMVSTAYIAGDLARFSETDRECGQTLRNGYEASKFEAEKLVAAWKGGRHTIYRPSILVDGDQVGSQASRHGFHGVRNVFELLRRTLFRMIPSDSAYEAAGFRFAEGEVLQLPLFIDCAPDITLNLVPVDWAAQMMVRLMDYSASNTVYHLVHPNPANTRWVFEVSLKIIEIEGMQFGKGPQAVSGPAQRWQQNLNKSLGIFKPYLQETEAAFGDEMLRQRLGKGYFPPPEIDEEFLGRILGSSGAARLAP